MGGGRFLIARRYYYLLQIEKIKKYLI